MSQACAIKSYADAGIWLRNDSVNRIADGTRRKAKLLSVIFASVHAEFGGLEGGRGLDKNGGVSGIVPPPLPDHYNLSRVSCR
jgi:hypothetical protein